MEARLSGPSPCYELRNIKHVLSVLSHDGCRVLCMYEAPDAASVRAACEENGDPYERIWTGTRFTRPTAP